MSKTSGFIGAIVLGFLIVVCLIMLAACTSKVPAGYVGVVYSMNGGIQDKTLGQGWHIVAPGKKVIKYSIGVEQSYLTKSSKGDSKKNDSFNVPTSDGKTVNCDLEFSYRFDENQIADTFVKFKGRDGQDILDTFIKPKMIAWSQEVTAKYPVTQILGDKRDEINSELDTYLTDKFAKYGIVIDTVNFTRISADKQTMKAIQKKVTAQQELETAQVKAKTAKVNADKDLQVAEINAKKKKVEAEAEAKANKTISNSLTDKLIEQNKINKWDGKMPTVSGGQSIVDLRK
ncbi:Regulator of protease activity HflC, stomatin/prohibitin superfamily [Lachnospiraceae bacterium KHCPX20]|nr:Regulator of protease activity HflC, stomatin/prohibitin superfamily [Lachnospiraceae bacterium KHCPX20]